MASTLAVSGCSGSSGNPAPHRKSGGANSGAAAGGFCTTVWQITDKLATLDTDAIGGGSSAPSTSTWRSEAAAVLSVIGGAPTTQLGTSTAREDVTTMSGDLQDIVANGFANSNGGANLQSDLGIVQTDAQRLGYPQS